MNKNLPPQKTIQNRKSVTPQNIKKPTTTPKKIAPSPKANTSRSQLNKPTFPEQNKKLGVKRDSKKELFVKSMTKPNDKKTLENKKGKNTDRSSTKDLPSVQDDTYDIGKFETFRELGENNSEAEINKSNSETQKLINAQLNREKDKQIQKINFASPNSNYMRSNEDSINSYANLDSLNEYTTLSRNQSKKNYENYSENIYNNQNPAMLIKMGNIELDNQNNPMYNQYSKGSQSKQSINSNKNVNMNKKFREDHLFYDEVNNKTFVDLNENIEITNIQRPNHVTIDHYDSTDSFGMNKRPSKSPYDDRKGFEKKPSLKKKPTDKTLKTIDELHENHFNIIGTNSDTQKELLKIEMLQSQQSDFKNLPKNSSRNSLKNNDTKYQNNFEKERAAHKNINYAKTQQLTGINKINSLGTLQKEMGKFLNNNDGSTPSLNDQKYHDANSFSGSGKNLNDYYHENPVIAPSGFIIDQPRSKTPRASQPTRPQNEGSYSKRFEKSASRNNISKNDVSYDLPVAPKKPTRAKPQNNEQASVAAKQDTLKNKLFAMNSIIRGSERGDHTPNRKKSKTNYFDH